MSPLDLRAGAALSAAVALTLGALPSAAKAQDANASSSLEEIVVTPSLVPMARREIGTAVSVIEGDELQLRGYDGLADVLRTQTGVAVSNAGGPGKITALRIRGEESYRTLLMIDGVKALDPSAPQVAPGFDGLLMTDDLQRVEILRGPQGFMYGADAGGVVNVITRSGEGPPAGQAGLEYGELDTRKLDASVAGGGAAGDYSVAVTDLQTGGFNAQTADVLLRDDDGAENTTVHAKLGWNAAESLRLQLVMRDIDAEAESDDCFVPVTFENVHDCLSTMDQTTYKVSADYSAGHFSHAFGYSEVEVARDSLTLGQSSFASEGEIGRLEYTGTYRPSGAFGLVYGLDFQDEAMASGAEAFDREQKGYYAEYQGAFAERIYLSFGARYDDNDDFGEHTSARASVAYIQDLGSDTTLKYRASYGTGFRAPSLYEIAYNRGPNAFPPAAGFALAEETSEGYDIGIELDSANGFHFEATYFDQQIDDAIFFDLDDFSGYLQAPGISTSKGVELAVEAPLGERLRLLANWTHNDADTAGHAQRPQRPKDVANVGVLYLSTSDTFSLIANYRLSRDVIGIGNVPLDDYEVLDVSVSYAFSEKLQLTGRIENALDEDYQEIFGFNTSGRAAYAGLKLRF